jgi:exodeoxyribonuclease VII small subunit
MMEITYSQAIQRLEIILAQLEDGSNTVDELSELVKEATELIAICKHKLKNTESDIKEAFEKI